jgi:hypothetical protein
MVKKREKHKNNWIIIVVAIIAVIALILAAVAMTKANITGNAISDWIPWLKKDKVQEQTQVAGGGTGLSTNCIGDVYSVSDCHGICKTGQTCTKLGSSRNWCCVKDSSTENTQIGEGEVYRGLLAEKYLDAGMSVEDLRDYSAGYDENGNLKYEIIGGTKVIPGEGYYLEEDEKGILQVKAAQGASFELTKCACNSDEGCSGSEAGCKRISLGGSGGSECVKDDQSSQCSGSDCKCKERWWFNVKTD